MPWGNLWIVVFLGAMILATLYHAIDVLLDRRIAAAAAHALLAVLWSVAGVGAYREILGSQLAFMPAALILWVVGLVLAAALLLIVNRLTVHSWGSEIDTSQAVLIHLPPVANDDGYDMGELELIIAEALERDGIGEVDGDEIGYDSATLYVFGPDAEALLVVLEPVLRSHPMAAGARLELYSHWPDALLRTIELPAAV